MSLAGEKKIKLSLTHKRKMSTIMSWWIDRGRIHRGEKKMRGEIIGGAYYCTPTMP
jgi:hypothetical protein